MLDNILQIITIILLAWIALNTNPWAKRKLRKKAHYLNKIDVTYKKIWDMEFLRNQHKLNREGIRVEYDRQKEAIDAVETYVDLIKIYGVEKAKELMKDAEKAYQARHNDNPNRENYFKKGEDMPQEDKDMLESLEKEAKAKKEDLERMEKQMQSIDKMIDGPLGEGEMTPLGTDKPLNEILDGLRAVIEMLKDEIKKL